MLKEKIQQLAKKYADEFIDTSSYTCQPRVEL